MPVRLTAAQAKRLLHPLADDHSGRNAQNRATGQRFEDRLEAYHANLLASGIATVMRTNPKIRVTAPGKAVIIGKGEVDYIAFLSTGRVIHFDAKSRADKAFSLADEHQVDWLRTMHRYGHVAGYLVYWSDYDRVCWHPIAGIERRVRMADGIAVDGVRWLDLLEKL